MSVVHETKEETNMGHHTRMTRWILLSSMVAWGHGEVARGATPAASGAPISPVANTARPAAGARRWTAPARIVDWGSGYLSHISLAMDGKARGTVVASGQPKGPDSKFELHAYQFGPGATSAIRDTVLRSGPLEVDELVLRVSDSGQGLVTWSEIGGVPVLASRLDGKTATFGKVATLCCSDKEEGAEVRVHRPNQVVLPDGSALVIWEEDGKMFSMRSEGADGHWTKPKLFADRHCGFMGCDQEPVLAVDRLGNVTLVWTGALKQADTEANGVDIVATRFDSKLGWAPGVRVVRRIGTEEKPLDMNGPRLFSLATGPRGETLLAWSERDVFAAYRSPADGKWSKARLVSQEGIAFFPTAAIDSQGHAVMVWGDSGGGKLRAAHATNPGDAWSATKVIESDRSSEAIVPSLAGMANGDIILAWGTYEARLTTYSATMPAGTTVPLASRPDAKAGRPLIAANEAGDVVVVWVERRGDRHELWLSRTVPSGQGET